MRLHTPKKASKVKKNFNDKLSKTALTNKKIVNFG